MSAVCDCCDVGVCVGHYSNCYDLNARQKACSGGVKFYRLWHRQIWPPDLLVLTGRCCGGLLIRDGTRSLSLNSRYAPECHGAGWRAGREFRICSVEYDSDVVAFDCWAIEKIVGYDIWHWLGSWPRQRTAAAAGAERPLWLCVSRVLLQPFWDVCDMCSRDNCSLLVIVTKFRSEAFDYCVTKYRTIVTLPLYGIKPNLLNKPKFHSWERTTLV